MTTASSGVRGPYAKTAQVKQRILDACIEAFAATGYRAATMKEIAERAGISERGLAHHFASKADLLAAVLERHEGENTHRVSSAAGLEALLDMLEIVASDSAQPGLVELHTNLSAEAVSPEHPAHEHYRERYSKFREFAVRSFAELRRAGELDSPLGDEELGAMYVALSDGLQLQWLYDRDAVDSARTLRRFLASVIPRLATGASNTGDPA